MREAWIRSASWAQKKARSEKGANFDREGKHRFTYKESWRGEDRLFP
jgi:hypothetical protein